MAAASLQVAPDGVTIDSPLLDVSDLSLTFQTDRGELQAVRGVSVQLERGRTLGIVGESGSGKSVMMRSVLGLLPRTAQLGANSSVRFAGRELTGISVRAWRQVRGAEIAMVFQDPMTSLNPVVRVGRQVTESMRFHDRASKAAARHRAIELLSQVGIPEPERRLAAYPHELSGGMRQRIAIAIALACSPRLLIADEPTTALDVTIQRQILDLLAGLQSATDLGMVLITHDLGVVAGRTNDIAVMYAGRVVESAPTAVLFQRPRHPYTEALLASIPRVTNVTHSRLRAIPGRLPDMTKPPVGCAFAARCRYAQARCVAEDPCLSIAAIDGHRFACFYPVGTEAGTAALAANVGAGANATGTPARSMTGDE